ncbi:NRPS-like enzyme [Aspergillus eucalypticola CBS 122712]|uniref:NRPS-like enzyme n=1 Tax=Aspergillus eucalypticola (strain CBS 122712 / IBT 29274) TaxID=1448314 RepID=A0A317W8H8_ASPEC|nr:NRPS-like enzyme [Aspergillus eucalypticola CBS 122712]PWY82419.1 NRPS-like enzyme [Aspergillus eucalypticola CBS 122712]
MGSADVSGRLLTQLVDQQAKDQPDRLYCLHPSSQDADCEWRPITFQQVSAAVNHVAWWIDSRLPGRKQQILAYIGTNDLRYLVFELACMKTGHAALLLSTRNSQAAFHHLLSKTHCSVLVDGSERPQLKKVVDQVEVACSDLGLERWRMDPVWDVFAASPVKPYSHRENFTDIEDRPAIIIHSSGTTGLPKPVTLTHGYLATMDQMQTLPVPQGRESAQLFLRHKGEMRFCHGPLFHFIGIVCVFECIFYETPFLLSPDRPLTQDLFSRIMATPNPPRWCLIAPFVLQDLWSSEKGRQAIQGFSAVNFGGAPLSSATGNAISSHFRLQTLMGSSETGYTPTLLCEDPADWDCFEWNPAFEHRMEEVGDGLWELVIPRPSSRRYHGIFHAFPNLSEYRTGDLFEPHPTKPRLWRSKGRADDIIVLNNGEKLNPIDAEHLLETHSLVHRAAIFGQNRFQVALLVRPVWDELPETWTPQWLKQALEPLVKDANGLLPAHGQIHHNRIAVASPDRPFALAPKGSLRRRETAQLYEDVINALYSDATGNEGSIYDVEKLKETTMEGIELWLQEAVSRILGGISVDLDADIVTLGMDSLQVVRLAQALQDAADRMRQSKQIAALWTSAVIYEQATVRRLARTLFRQLHGHIGAEGEEHISSFWPREHQLTHAIWQQAQNLQLSGKTVLLTGSTGELGSYLLEELLQDPTVAQVYCLNRSADAESRQLARFREKRLADGWLVDTSRVKFLLADLSQERLGLTGDEYSYLRERVDIVFHNAWMVNFNLPLSSFHAQLKGTGRLLNLIKGSPRQAAFHFISSIAAVSGRPTIVPETDHIAETLHGPSIVLSQGYAESKYAAEVLCDLVARETKQEIAVHRVGQLGGPTDAEAGMWTTRDWFPALVRTSQTMKELPDNIGSIPVDWVPIDVAARSIVQIACGRRNDRLASTGSNNAEVYHITNPHISNWEPLAHIISQACSSKIIPLKEWVQNLTNRVSDPKLNEEALLEIPAASLLGFFRSLADSESWIRPPADTTNAQKHSAALRALGPVDAPLMKVWLQQWSDWIPELRI